MSTCSLLFCYMATLLDLGHEAVKVEDLMAELRLRVGGIEVAMDELRATSWDLRRKRA